MKKLVLACVALMVSASGAMAAEWELNCPAYKGVKNRVIWNDTINEPLLMQEPAAPGLEFGVQASFTDHENYMEFTVHEGKLADTTFGITEDQGYLVAADDDIHAIGKCNLKKLAD